ncbi:MAG: hypothetical protein Q4Q53_02965 [Methanocorpusculum sp.]|nr:hypothetical protein [Methanocorpusculum sp.]
MSDKRIVTIGVTVNLGNYESLRLEVSDTAETKSDADELRAFLSDVLDGFGNNNATAKSAIEKYKDKILSDSETEPEQEESFSEMIPPVFSEEEPEAETKKPEPEMFEPVLFAEPEKEEPLFTEIKPEPKTEPEQEQIREPEPSKVSVPISKPSEGEYTCEKCGAKISKVQRDVSNLFMGKSLCKNCMK